MSRAQFAASVAVWQELSAPGTGGMLARRKEEVLGGKRGEKGGAGGAWGVQANARLKCLLTDDHGSGNRPPGSGGDKGLLGKRGEREEDG